MQSQRIWMALPYAVLFGLAAWFYHRTGLILFDHRGENLGPDFWPRVALAGIMVICLFQSVRLLFFSPPASSSHPEHELEDEEDHAPRSNLLLAAGLALTVAYGVLVPILGFLLTTVIFMVLFIYAGQYRSHVTIWLSSLIGAVLMMILFQKVVYVSLPRGMPPFDQLTDMLLSLF